MSVDPHTKVRHMSLLTSLESGSVWVSFPMVTAGRLVTDTPKII